MSLPRAFPFVAGCVASCLIAARPVPATNHTVSGEPELCLAIGPVLGLAGGATYPIPIAFNSQEDEFFVTWQQFTDIYGRRVTADGLLAGDVKAIRVGPTGFYQPAVAYNPDNNQYFVSWRVQGGDFLFNNGYGRLLTATGDPVGDEVHVSNAAYEATLVFNPVTGEFLHHARGSGTLSLETGRIAKQADGWNVAGGGVAGIYYRRISGDGVPLESPTPITTGNSAPAGEVAVNSNTGEYLSTWRDQAAGDLKGRLLDGDGTPLTDSFVISDVFPDGAASVAYDPIADRYLVVFGGSTAPRALFGQFVDSTGEPVGELMSKVDGDILRPKVAFDPVHEVYLVIWMEGGVNPTSIRAHLVSRHGKGLGQEVGLTSGDLSLYGPMLAANRNDGGFLVTWQQGAVKARLVEVVGCDGE